MRRFVAVLSAVVLMMVGLAVPAEAHGPQLVSVVVRTSTFEPAVDHALTIWNRDQGDYRLVLADQCRRGQRCIVVGETWDAGDWSMLDGIEYGGYSWLRGTRCQVRIPLVLTHEPLLARFSDALDSAGQSRRGVPVDVWVQGGVAAHEIGHCLGYDDRPGAGVMSTFPDDRLAQ